MLLQPYFSGGGPGGSSAGSAVAALTGLDVGLNSPAESMAPLSPSLSEMADSPSEVSVQIFYLFLLGMLISDCRFCYERKIRNVEGDR